MLQKVIEKDIERFLEEDDLQRHIGVATSLPMDSVHCALKIKSPMTLAGTAWFTATFNYLGADLPKDFLQDMEGKEFSEPYQIDFELPFAIALTGERVALNLLARASAVATHTKRFVDLAKNSSVRILDTRKTTPGLRSLEKYAVTVGGGLNHRFGPTEMWMVKDNHKTFFGGVQAAVNFFKSQASAYAPIEVEVHDLSELSEALELGVNHIMLDNFSPTMVKEAVKSKKPNTTIEVSGGMTLSTLSEYLIDGVDFISVGSLTYGAPPVDLSLKHGAKA